jgi:hypothetical protein
MRGVPHTLALNTTNAIEDAGLSPDQRLGWGGDGAPGRGTLNEFAVGALVQHFPKTLNRKPGVDFRPPTQAEVDALEAFQLFTGRQKAVDVRPLVFREPRANNGSALFLTGAGQCSACHVDVLGLDPGAQALDNPNFNTGVDALRPVRVGVGTIAT